MDASWGERSGVRDLLRIALLALFVGGLAVGMAACMDNVLNPPKTPALLVATPVVSDGRGEVQILVADMPGGGVAAIAIDNLGITYANIKAASIVATGLGGFQVIVQDFTTTPGKGRLVAINPTSGVADGAILKVSFETSSGQPLLTIRGEDEGKVTLGSAADMLITPWDLKAYYAKQGRK
jgi:hypothetical protein